MAENTHHPMFPLQTHLIFVAVASTAIVVAIYHCIAVLLCGRRQYSGGSPAISRREGQGASGSSSSAGSSRAALLLLIPAHKFKKGIRLAGEEGMCAVCLCEYEEGEELKTLPGCAHSFHAPCIDMWLYSHPNCPVCRASATISPSAHNPTRDFDVQSMAV